MHEDAVLFNMFFKHHLNGVYLELGALDGIFVFHFSFISFLSQAPPFVSSTTSAESSFKRARDGIKCVCVRERESERERERESFMRSVCVY